MDRRTIFFVSDQTGVTAETMGHSLLTQFEGVRFNPITIPFIADRARAVAARAQIDATAAAEGVRPVVFSTLIRDDLREEVMQAHAVFLDFFDAFLGPQEVALGTKSSHAEGRAHGISDTASYTARINATNFAMANDDGSTTREYDQADVILIGVSRSGKTPTCLYMALQYGIYAANYPLTDDDLDNARLPASIAPFRSKLFGLTIEPERLREIRTERRPNTRYASAAQVTYEVRQAEALLKRFGIPYFDTTRCSIEEIGSRIMQAMRIHRRVHP